MQTVNFQAPTDAAAEAEQIARSRRYAELMQQQSMQPMGDTQMAGGWAIRKSPFEGLAKMLQAYGGRKGQEAADERTKALADKVRQQGVADVSAFTGALQGSPAVTDINQTNQGLDSFDPKAAQAPDRAKAIAIAMQSQHPMVQNAGSSMLAQMLKSQDPYSLREGEKRYGPNGEVIADNAKRPETKVLSPGQTVFQVPTQGPAVPLANVPEKVDYNKPFLPDGKPNPAYQDYEFGKARAGKPDINSTVINAGPKAFETELGKLDAEQLGEWRKNAMSGQQTLGIVENLRGAIKEGVYSGGGAQAKTAVANLINGITGATPKALPGSQLFNAESSKLILEKVKQLGANPSNADRDFIEKTVPNLATSPQARDALIGFLEKKATEQIEIYKKADAHARQNNGLKGFNMLQTPSPQGNVMDFNSLPKGGT